MNCVRLVAIRWQLVMRIVQSVLSGQPPLVRGQSLRMDVAEVGCYKEVAGNQVCTVCPDWKTTPSEGTVSQDDCSRGRSL